jgi:5-hydroxyisourate hydrolase-like protein (transthyretin family)
MREVIVIWNHRCREFVLAVLLIAGCGPGAGDTSQERLAQMSGGNLKDVVPVSGKVLVDGEPKAGVTIYLYRSTGGEQIAECRTNPDGTYCWATHLPCDGIEAGSYRLAFKCFPKLRRNDQIKETDDLFQGRYSDPMKVEFLLTVEEGSPQTDVDYALTTK